MRCAPGHPGPLGRWSSVERDRDPVSEAPPDGGLRGTFGEVGPFTLGVAVTSECPERGSCMSLNFRRLDLWLIVGFGVLAVWSWGSQAIQAALAEEPLSTRALFAWLAVAMAGLALGLTLGMLTAPLRARRLALARTTHDWDMGTFGLVMGIYFLGADIRPIHDPSVSVWDWTFLVLSALTGACMLGLALIIRGEPRTLPAPSSPSHGLPDHPSRWP